MGRSIATIRSLALLLVAVSVTLQPVSAFVSCCCSHAPERCCSEETLSGCQRSNLPIGDCCSDQSPSRCVCSGSPIEPLSHKAETSYEAANSSSTASDFDVTAYKRTAPNRYSRITAIPSHNIRLAKLSILAKIRSPQTKLEIPFVITRFVGD